MASALLEDMLIGEASMTQASRGKESRAQGYERDGSHEHHDAILHAGPWDSWTLLRFSMTMTLHDMNL